VLHSTRRGVRECGIIRGIFCSVSIALRARKATGQLRSRRRQTTPLSVAGPRASQRAEEMHLYLVEITGMKWGTPTALAFSTLGYMFTDPIIKQHTPLGFSSTASSRHSRAFLPLQAPGQFMNCSSPSQLGTRHNINERNNPR